MNKMHTILRQPAMGTKEIVCLTLTHAHLWFQSQAAVLAPQLHIEMTGSQGRVPLSTYYDRPYKTYILCNISLTL